MVLSLYYNRIRSFLFVNAKKVYQFKGKNPEIKDYTLGFANISKDFTINSMNKTGLRAGGGGGGGGSTATVLALFQMCHS